MADNKAAIDGVKELDISNTANLTSLTSIEYFTNLEVLWCSMSGLTSLDVSKLLKFEPTGNFVVRQTNSTLGLKVTATQKTTIDNTPDWIAYNNVSPTVVQ